MLAGWGVSLVFESCGGAREVGRWAVVGLPARCRGAAAGEPQHRVQQRSGRLWTRLKALTRSGVATCCGSGPVEAHELHRTPRCRRVTSSAPLQLIVATPAVVR